jgi:hypothetical protein
VVKWSVLGCVAALLVTTGAAQAANFQVGLQDGAMTASDWATQRSSIDRAKSSGAQIVRITLSWKSVASACGATPTGELRSPNAACYDWSAIDRAVARARLRHLELLASVWQIPSWVLGTEDSTYVGVVDNDFALFRDRYVDFIHAAATRYAPGSPTGTIGKWTIMNEPNSRTFWHSNTTKDMVRYASLYSRSARTIKAVSRGILVAVGPLGPKSVPFKPISYVRGVRTALKRTDPKVPIDAWALNPYPGTAVSPFDRVYRNPSAGIGNFEDFIAVLDQDSMSKGDPVWITEFAYQTNPPDRAFGTSLLNQSLWMGQAMDRAAETRRVPLFIWYVLQDPADLGDWNSGLFTANGTAKPSRTMFGRAISVAPRKLDTSRGARVWGRSSFDAAGLRLEWSRDRRHWKRLRADRSWGGALVTRVPRRIRTWVRVHDSHGVGQVVHVSA